MAIFFCFSFCFVVFFSRWSVRTSVTAHSRAKFRFKGGVGGFQGSSCCFDVSVHKVHQIGRYFFLFFFRLSLPSTRLALADDDRLVRHRYRVFTEFFFRPVGVAAASKGVPPLGPPSTIRKFSLICFYLVFFRAPRIGDRASAAVFHLPRNASAAFQI